MSGKHIEIGNVTLRLQGGNLSQQAAATIAQLTFQRVQQKLAQRETDLGKGRTIDLLRTRPVSVTNGASPEEIARATAAEICRALREN